MSDGQHTALTSLQVVITRIQTTTITRIVRVPVVRTVWRAHTILVRRDPLVQTFSFTQNRVISAVVLQFTQRDCSIPVRVQIRGVTTGVPNETVLAEKVIPPSEINMGFETKVVFEGAQPELSDAFGSAQVQIVMMVAVMTEGAAPADAEYPVIFAVQQIRGQGSAQAAARAGNEIYVQTFRLRFLLLNRSLFSKVCTGNRYASVTKADQAMERID